MSDDTVPQTPRPRRYVWLDIALAVAKTEIPAPYGLRVYEEHGPNARIVSVDVRLLEDAEAWAKWLDADPLGFGAWTAARDGWFYQIHLLGRKPPTEAEQAKAAEVIEAIGATS